MYKIETHFHTSETSLCSSISSVDGILALKGKGYSGVIVTDHYYKGWFDAYNDMSFEEKIDIWLKGYRNASAEGERLNINVYLGMEIRFVDSPNDYLVFGITEELLKNNHELYLLGEESFKKFADCNNLFFLQAHPFRPYIILAEAKNIHGIEVFNGNRRHESRNYLAEEFAKENDLIMLSGSDFHEYEDLNSGGIYLENLPTSNKELVEMLMARKFILFKG